MKKSNFKSDGLQSRFAIGLLLAISVVFWAFSLKFSTVESPVFTDNSNFESDLVYMPVTNFKQHETKKATKSVAVLSNNTFAPSTGQTGNPTNADGGSPETKPLPNEGVENIEENSIIYVAEVMPEFPGGYNAMSKFIRSTVRYPEKAMREKLGGRVKVSFVVEKDGSLSDISVVSKFIGYGLEEEALRVIKAMPHWKPGLQGNIPVRVRFNLPIDFVIY